MAVFKVDYIKAYFSSRGWTMAREGNRFVYFAPPANETYPQDYSLEIPKSDDLQGFDNYILRLIDELKEILPEAPNNDDLKILFSRQNSILKLRVFDSDTLDGTIGLTKHIESLDSIKKILSQAVTFVVSNKPIFGEANFEVTNYLNNCRALQSEKGSYITKIEVPDFIQEFTISKVDTSNVTQKLFDVLEFVEEEIFSTKKEPEINENYISENKAYINYELLLAIKDVYSKSRINNIQYQMFSKSTFRTVETVKVQTRIKYFTSYLKKIKTSLLQITAIEVVGKIKKLTSMAPMHSPTNEIFIDVITNNEKQQIKIILDSEQYLQAIEAHKNENKIRVKGKAKQVKTMLIIDDVEKFEVIQ
jgi:hypothetical protein